MDGCGLTNTCARNARGTGAPFFLRPFSLVLQPAWETSPCADGAGTVCIFVPHLAPSFWARGARYPVPSSCGPGGGGFPSTRTTDRVVRGRSALSVARPHRFLVCRIAQAPVCSGAARGNDGTCMPGMYLPVPSAQCHAESSEGGHSRRLHACCGAAPVPMVHDPERWPETAHTDTRGRLAHQHHDPAAWVLAMTRTTINGRVLWPTHPLTHTHRR